MSAPILLFAVGNQSRGDDALAPLLVREIETWSKAAGLGKKVELLEDYQWQIEHVTDLVGRSAVLFIDADVSCAQPYRFSEIAAEKNGGYTTHAMHPAALLHAYRRVYGADAPPAFLLQIRGHDFELGNPVSERALVNLGDAIGLVTELCKTTTLQHWRSLADKRMAAE